MKRQRGLTLLHLIVGLLLIFSGLIGMKACENHNASLKATAQAAKLAADKAKQEAEEQKRKQIEAEKAAFEYEAKQKAEQEEFFKSYDDLAIVVKRWDDGLLLAGSTPRMSLPDRVAELQKIKQDTELLLLPLCLEQQKKILVRSMESSINGLIIFLHNRSNAGEMLSLDAVNTGKALREEFGKGFSDCKEGIENQ